ncbi:ATP-binding protein [Cryobacterium serini]|uniref:ATP-binding protein n=1 Tax=Cryobacterium serini TaxID=1259201 RepID=UPI0024088F3D|nr:ATP-binding protein [Cryobacterium serini]
MVLNHAGSGAEQGRSPAPQAEPTEANIHADLIVIDDIGLLAVGTDAAEGLYRLVDAAYEKRSIAVSSNLHPAGFDELMPKTLATATVDRLLHHAHVCQTSGDSIRLTQALAGKGVTPMS